MPRSYYHISGQGVLAAYLCSCCSLFAATRSDTRQTPHMDCPPPAEITLHLDKAQASPGEEVRLTGWIPKATPADVTGVSHSVLLLGDYDKNTKRLVNKEPPFQRVDAAKAFDKLPNHIVFSHPYGFDVVTAGHKGIEFRFRPNRIGIFLIIATWRSRGSGKEVSSLPIILVVRPPIDASGVAIVKPEWLAEVGFGSVQSESVIDKRR